MFEGLKIRAVENRLKLAALIKIEQFAEATTKDALRDTDEDGWSLIGGAEIRGLEAVDQTTMREQAQTMYYKNPHARNIVRLFEKYIVGKGFKINPKSEDESLIAYWENFLAVNDMKKRAKEIVRRTIRDGEVFIRWFLDGLTPVIRFMNAADVKTPLKEQDTNEHQGIQTNPQDIEDVTGYWYNNELIPAEEVTHLKILVDSDVVRGRSLLEVIMPFLSMYYKWLNTRMKLSMLRSTVALIKKVTGTRTQAANIVSDQNTNISKAPDSSSYTKAPEGVSVITTNQGVDYDFKTPNLQAADVHHDGRAVLLAVAAGCGLPEFMVTSDASNANYASTMVAEGPAVMEFEDWQETFAILFNEIFERVILQGIAVNEIPPVELITVPVVDEAGIITQVDMVVDISTEALITFPDLAVRDMEKETKSLILQNGQGWVSDHTATAELGRDYDVERELIREELEDEDAELIDREDPENDHEDEEGEEDEE